MLVPGNEVMSRDVNVARSNDFMDVKDCFGFTESKVVVVPCLKRRVKSVGSGKAVRSFSKTDILRSQVRFSLPIVLLVLGAIQPTLCTVKPT